jgi:hypothetical protein
MSWLDDLLGNVLSFGGELLPQRKTWRLLGLVQAVDNPDTGTTDITFAEPPIGPPIDIDGEVEVTKESSGTTLYLHNGSVATLPDDAEMGTKYRLMFSVGPGASASLEVANDGFQNIYWQLNGENQSGQTLEIDGEINALYEIELFTETDGDDVYRSWIVSPVRDQGPFVVNAAGSVPGITAVSSETFTPAIFAYTNGDAPIAPNTPTDWVGVTAVFQADTGADAGVWAALAAKSYGTDHDASAIYGEAVEGQGVYAYSAGGTYPTGAVGHIEAGVTTGAGVIGIRGNYYTTAVGIGGGAGVVGYSDITAGVFGYTPTTQLPGVKGMSGHANGIGVAGVTLNLATPAAYIAGWQKTGVAGIGGEAGGFGVGGEYAGTGYGEAIEGYNAVNGPGVAGYSAADSTQAWGVIGGLKNTVTRGAGVAGYHGIGTAFGGTWDADDAGGCGVFGYSDLEAGVKGMPGAAGIPGVKGVVYETPTAQSRGVEGRGSTVGFGMVATTALSTVNLSTQLANWDTAALFAIADADAGSGIWTAAAVWAYSTTGGDLYGAYMGTDKGTGIQGETLGGTGPAGVIGLLNNGVGTEGVGVLGVNGNNGVAATAVALANGAGVMGYSDLTAGVYGYSVGGALVPGVLGVATANNAGGGEFYGHAGGAGVYGESPTGIAVQGYTAGANPAGYFEQAGTGAGVVGDASPGTGHGVVAKADTTSPVSAALLIIGQDDFPSVPVAGAVIYHIGNAKHYGYNGSGWQAFY